MGRELFDAFPVVREVFQEADEALGFSISRLCFDGPEEELRLTENTQPAILTVSMAALRVLAERGVRSHFAAGHSLGEYSAQVAAGTISFADAVRTVRNRGRYMQEAVPEGVGAMAAILGMTAADVIQACADAARESGGVVSAANLNAPEQTVISGAVAAVELASAKCKERGAKRAIPLKVSAPFHCALMRPAQDRLASRSGGDGISCAQAERGFERRCDLGRDQQCRARCVDSPGDRRGSVGGMRAAVDCRRCDALC